MSTVFRVHADIQHQAPLIYLNCALEVESVLAEWRKLQVKKLMVVGSRLLVAVSPQFFFCFLLKKGKPKAQRRRGEVNGRISVPTTCHYVYFALCLGVYDKVPIPQLSGPITCRFPNYH